MDLRQLAALTAVADTGTFSAAADVLHTVQSNVSTHVARLERELGVILVDRAAGRLTEEGEVVVARSRRISGELAALVADVASLRSDVTGGVRLGVIGTTGRWLVPPLLMAMAERHPNVRVSALEGNTTALLPSLASGRLDLALLNLPVDDPDIEVTLLFEEDLIVVAPAGHPLAQRDEVTLVELADHELLLTPPGTSIRVDLDRAAAAAGVALRAKAELDGIRLIASLTFEGFGAAVLPASAAPASLTGEWRRVAISGIGRRQVGLARRRRGLLSAPARALSAVVVDVVGTASGAQPGVFPVPTRSRPSSPAGASRQS
jgi:LysR family hydrogen peroxide-inducible transcriptional activator